MHNTHTAPPLVVVGASAAGLAAVEAARESGYGGPILLLNAEDRAPYKRTKISKTMVDSPERDAFALHEPGWYEQQRVQFRPRTRVLAVHEAEQQISLDDGCIIPYGALILALGAEPVAPDVEGLDNVRAYAPYTQAETEALAAQVQATLRASGRCRVAIVGCGVTALEVADQLVRLGATVTLFGRGRRIMRGALDSELESRLRARMTEAGVTVFEDRIVRRVQRDGEALSLSLGAVSDAAIAEVGASKPSGPDSNTVSSGAGTLEADVLVVACGLRPRGIPGHSTQQSASGGIPVDRALRVEGFGPVYACGDCARHPDGRITWLWRDAKRQGAVAGRNAASELFGSSSLSEYSYVPFRLKTAVFGDYYFSIAAAGFEFLQDDDSPASLVDRAGDRYRAVWVRDGRVVRIVMANDKARADEYMEAVVEGWPPQRLGGLEAE